MKNKFIALFAMFMAISLLFNSCEKLFDPDTDTAKDNAKAEGAMSDVFGLVSGNAEGGEKSADEVTCYTVELSGTVENRILTLNFGTAGCPDANGVIHKGKIVATFTGRWFITGAKTEITFVDYYRNGEKLEGTVTATYKSNVTEGTTLMPVHEIVSNNMMLTLTDGSFVKWNATHTIKWISGYFTKARTDNKQLINSVLKGENRNGDKFESKGTDLVSQFPCRLFVSGTVEITKPSGKSISIDFGNGECDGKFSVTQSGVTVNVDE